MIQMPAFNSFYPVVQHGIRIVIILSVAFIATRIAGRWIPRLRSRLMRIMTHRHIEPDIELEKRTLTLGEIIRKAIVVAIWVIGIMMALKEAGFDVAPILAGAGVLGLAVGFGAQNLVRDVISGMFMLIENQIRVNDVAIINGTGGLVEEINLRTTVLRGLDGTVHTFPNGTITTLSNMTREFSYYVFDLRVDYNQDTDRVIEIVKEIADQMRQEPAYRSLILEPLDVLGVDQFTESAVIVKVRIKTAPIQQWAVGREMNRRIKKRFGEQGIAMPFPQRTLHFGEAGRLDREQLKALIAEVLQEAKVIPGAKASA